MAKRISIRPCGLQSLDLSFSDGSTARWSAAPLIERDTELTRPLDDDPAGVIVCTNHVGER